MTNIQGHAMSTTTTNSEYAVRCTCGFLFVGSQEGCSRNMTQHMSAVTASFAGYSSEEVSAMITPPSADDIFGTLDREREHLTGQADAITLFNEKTTHGHIDVEPAPPVRLDGCTCGGIGSSGSHRPGCAWAAR